MSRTPTMPPRPTPSTAPTTELIEVRVARGSFLQRAAVRAWELLRSLPARRSIRSVGRGVRLAPPIRVYGGGGIVIGDGATIWPHARLIAHNVEPGGAPKLEIGPRVAIHPYAHISAIKRIRIGEGALFASNVYISDHDHDWLDPDDPPISNGRVLAAPVEIGANVWLGERVCVLRGVTIGEGSIVGAASVVTKSIPPRSIAVGAPARVIKRWDEATHAWVSVHDAAG